MTAEQALFGLARIWWETTPQAQHVAKTLAMVCLVAVVLLLGKRGLLPGTSRR